MICMFKMVKNVILNATVVDGIVQKYSVSPILRKQGRRSKILVQVLGLVVKKH